MAALGLQLGKITKSARNMSPPSLGGPGNGFDGDTGHDRHCRRLIPMLVGSGQVMPQVLNGLLLVVQSKHAVLFDVVLSQLV